MKYFIRAYSGGWKEVTKEKADSFIKGILGNVTMPLTEERKEEIINYHYKEVEEIDYSEAESNALRDIDNYVIDVCGGYL